MTRRKRARGQGGVCPPPHVGCRSRPVKTASTKETEVKQKSTERREPETESIQARKRHVSRANHQRDQVIRKPEQDGHGDKENHGRALHGEHAVEYLRSDTIVMSTHQLH